jgi:hypothetical protein
MLLDDLFQPRHVPVIDLILTFDRSDKLIRSSTCARRRHFYRLGLYNTSIFLVVRPHFKQFGL